jgi:hypothetical protein
LSTLQSQGLVAESQPNGDVSFVEPDSRTAWKFAGKDNPAYPSAVRYVYTRSSGELHAELTILCEAAAERCEKFRSDIRDNLAQLSKKMAGDPAAKCSVNDNSVKCGAEAEPTQTTQQIYVRVREDSACTIDDIAIPCADIGRRIRADHPSDDPKVAVCAGARVTHDVVGKVLDVISEVHLSPEFGCPPH